MAVVTRSSSAKADQNYATSRRIKSILKHTLLVVLALVALAPFILAFLGTFKTDAEIIAYPPRILPENWLFENWAKTWNTDFGQGARWYVRAPCASSTTSRRSMS